jgi:hypothetical protein
MVTTPTLKETRGQEQDFLLYFAEDGVWTIRIATNYALPGLRERVLARSGMRSREFSAFPVATQQAVEATYLLEEGDVFDCIRVAPERDSRPVDWISAQRDGLVMMLFFSLEKGRHVLGPLPSRLNLCAPGIPEALRGTFRDPIWERLT